MFEKLFRKSRTQVEADDLGSPPAAQEDHGTIAAAPHALALLRASKEASTAHQLPRSPVAAEDEAHEELGHSPAQLSEARHSSKPAQGSSAKPWQRHRPADKAPTHHTVDSDAGVAAGQPQQTKAAVINAEYHVSNEQAVPAAVGPVVLPALCQVRPSAEYVQQQHQHTLTRQKQQPHQTAYSLPQLSHENHQSFQPALSSRYPQQVEQSSMPLYPATMGYGSWLQQQQQQQQPLSIETLQQKLLLEAKAREEVEDMLLRYERHLKAETAARLAAEQQAAAASSHAADFRQQIASNGRQAKQHSDNLAAEQAAIQQERAELEQMRADFEAQLHTARNELAKAKAALSSNEERVRAAEAEERAQLVAEYELRLSGMMSEVECLREEVARRTQLLTAEMERWKRQATLNAAAVIEAKNEVLERKRELDSTKDKLDHLVEKLYAGREANVSLSGAIAAAANYQQVSTNQFLAQQATGMSSLAGGRSSMINTAAAGVMWGQHSKAGTAAYHLEDNMMALGGTAGTVGYKTANRNSVVQHKADSKPLVSTMQQRGRASQVAAAAAGQLSPRRGLQHGGSMIQEVPPLQFLSVSGSPGMPMSHHQMQLRSSILAASTREPPHLQAMYSSPMDADNNSRIPHPALVAAAKDLGISVDPHRLPDINSRSARQHRTVQERSTSNNKAKKDEGGSYASLHRQQQQHPGAAAEGVSPPRRPENDAYKHVVSRYAQPAAGAASVRSTKVSPKQKQQPQKKQVPDRFAEGAKNAAMIAAMAHKFG